MPIDPDENRLLTPIPNAKAAALLGRIIGIIPLPIAFFVLTASIVAMAVIGQARAVMPVWYLYLLVVCALAIAIRLVIGWGAAQWRNLSSRQFSGSIWFTAQLVVGAAVFFLLGWVVVQGGLWIWHWSRNAHALLQAVENKVELWLYHPSITLLVLTGAVLLLLLLILPWLARLWVSAQEDHVVQQELPVFHNIGKQMMALAPFWSIAEKNSLQLLRSDHMPTAWMLVFLFFGALTSIAHMQVIGQNYYYWMSISVVGAYVFAAFGFGNLVTAATTGSSVIQRDPLLPYRLSPVAPKTVLWAETVIATILPAIPYSLVDLVLVLMAPHVQIVWLPGAVLLTWLISLLYNIARIGIPTGSKLFGGGFHWQERGISVLVDDLTFLLLAIFLVPAARLLRGGHHVSLFPGWSYVISIAIVGLTVLGVSLWWRRRFAR
ncbi:MAG: hypothetical protein IMW91_10685 [Firmicutes bacterium]|nr:hypothetical protein [Bacillota bacterium]